MSIDELIKDFDWLEVMKYAKFKVDDIEEILKSEEGCQDEMDWLLLVKLKSGAYGYVEAGCDYTGWD